MIRHRLCAIAVTGLMVLLSGCSDGGPQTAEELGIAGAEVQNANSVRQDLEGLEETLKREGPAATAQAAQSVEENAAALVEDPANEDNADTYRKIAAGVTEIKGMSSASEIQSKLDELKSLAEGLPKE